VGSGLWSSQAQSKAELAATWRSAVPASGPPVASPVAASHVLPVPLSRNVSSFHKNVSVAPLASELVVVDGLLSQVFDVVSARLAIDRDAHDEPGPRAERVHAGARKPALLLHEHHRVLVCREPFAPRLNRHEYAFESHPLVLSTQRDARGLGP